MKSREIVRERPPLFRVYAHIYRYIAHMLSLIRVILGLQVGLLGSQVKPVGPWVQYMWVPRPIIIPTDMIYVIM